MAVPEGAASHSPGGVCPYRQTAASAVLYAAMAATAAACALLCSGIAQAQIVADPAAPGGQRPTVLVTPNGAPLVNIQTPSAAGVSRNTYRRFDVDGQGAVLNNSRTAVQSQIGGWVQGNPWLSRGGARVILNEVNSSDPSYLRGALEVAGQRAEVVLANPSGIVVDGAGFINASRVTLTTGTPVLGAGGHLDSYRVQGGSVQVGGQGLDFGGADYAAVLARAVEVNAGIWAKDLAVVAGAHQASADGAVVTPIAPVAGLAPEFLLDVKALGGMYAGHIFLRGTEAGLGMRNAGTLASTGALTLAGEGAISNSATVQATGALDIPTPRALTNSGALLGGADVSLQAATIANGGTVQAGGTARLAAMSGNLDNHIGTTGGTVSANRLDLASVADIDNSAGTLRQTGAGLLQVAAAGLDNTSGGTVGNRPVAGSGGTGTAAGTGNAAGTGTGPGSGTGSGTGTTGTTPSATVDLTPGTVRAHGALRNAGGKITSSGGIALTAARIDNSGGFLAVERIEGPVAALSNQQGDLRVAGDLHLAGDVLDNRAGTLLAGGRLDAAFFRVDNNGGVLQAGTLAVTAAGDIDNRDGTLRSTSTTSTISGLAVQAGGALDNRGGRIVGGTGVTLASGAALDNDTGLVHATSGLDVRTGGALSNRAGTLEAIGDTATLALQAGSIDSSGGRIVNAGTGASSIATAGSLNLGALTSGATTTAATLGGNGAVDITAGSLQLASGATIGSGADLTLSIDGAARNAGTIASAGAVQLSAAALDNRAGRIEAGNALAVGTIGILDNRGGTLRAVHALALSAGTDIANGGGAIEATDRDATLSARAAGLLDNGAGRIANAGSSAASSTTLAAEHIVNAASGAVLSNGALRVQATTLDNQAGATLGAGALVLDVTGTATNRGLIASNGTLALVQTAAALDNRTGRITAAGPMQIELQSLLNDNGVVATTQGSAALLSLRASSLTNSAGTVSSDGDLRIALGSDLRQDGLLHAGADLGLAVSGALVNQGTLEAGGTLRTDSTSLTNTLGAVIQAHQVGLDTPGALSNAGEIRGSRVQARADSIANTGAITGADIQLTTRTLRNTGDKALIGATGSVTIDARDSASNSDGATLYSTGDITLATARLHNRSATIEAGRDIAITAAAVVNERPLLSTGQTQALAETHTLTMPAWWHNNAWHGSTYATSVLGTNLTAYQLYYLDPADILETGQVVTADGQVIGRAVVRTHADDTSYFSGRAGMSGALGHRERIVATEGTRVIYYTLRSDNVANPDRVAGAAATAWWPGQEDVTRWDSAVPVDAAYGRCTTQCVLLTQPWQYTDPGSTIIRDTQVVLRPDTGGSELRREVTTTATDDTASLGAAARIAAGGNIRIAYSDSVTNRFGDILAGGRLDIAATTAGAGTVDNEALTLYRRYQFAGTSHFADGTVLPWNQPDLSLAIGSERGVLSGAQGVSITGRTVRNLDLSTGTAARLVDRVDLASGGQPAAPAATGSAAAAGQSTTGGGFIARPGALFSARPQAGVPYLYETRAAFANQRDWLSSDYLLSALGQDPATAQKRLGDGFYEQRLVNEQIAKLTGRRYLAGYDSDLQQYQALLDAGITYARQYGLVPGVSLSAEQMASLTSDLVWLQSETVTLADGSTQQVLVPHVYLAKLGEGVLAADGALVTGDSVRIEAGNIVNRGGVIGGAGTRSAVLVASADALNQGGTIAANRLAIAAGGDIRNESLAVTQNWNSEGANATSNHSATSASNVARIAAGQTLVLDAGRDIIDTAGQIGASGNASLRAGRDITFDTLATGSSEQVRVGSASLVQSQQHQQGGSLTAGGSLGIEAGRDITLTSTQVQAGQDAALIAGRHIAIGAAQDTSSFERRSDASATPAAAQTRASSTAQGSSIRTGGNLGLQAGTKEAGDITVTGSTLDAKGAAVLIASRDVNIVEARDTRSSHDEERNRRSGLLSSSTSHSERDSASDTSVASSIGGKTVILQAGHDANVRGSSVVSDQGTVILAGHDIAITAAANTESSSSLEEKTKSGVMGSGGVGVTVGQRAQTHQEQTNSTTAAASTVGSIGGDVTMVAGNRYTQTGSDVVAPAGDIDIRAKDVRITEARETTSTQTTDTFKQSGLTAAVSSAVLAAAQSTLATAGAVSNTGDARMKALGVASAALNAGPTAQAAQDVMANPAAAVNVSVSLGQSSSRSTSTQSSDTARGSSLNAGKNIRIVATGAGKDSDILIQGAQVSAGRNALLDAEGDIQLQAAKNTQQQHSTSQSSSGSIGVSLGQQTGVTVSASSARGNADGSDVSYTNTHVSGGQQVRLKSGGDTTVQGAVVSGRQVTADIAGDLHIESLQDTSTFDSKNKSVGGSLTVGPTGPTGGSLNVSKSKVNADYASVAEQSGIRAGDGGFDVRVQGHTDLVGGVIASTQKAVEDGQNVLKTASLRTRDIENRENYQASGFSLSGGYSAAGTGKASDGSSAGSVSGQGAVPHQAGGINGAAAGIASASAHQSSTTTSGVSGIAGNTQIRTGDAAKGLTKTFDQDKVQKEIAAQLQITSTFGQQAGKAIAEYADAKYQELKDTDPAEAAKWAEGGAYRLAAHAVAAGLTGGLEGALGAGASQLAIETIGKQIAATDLPLGVKTALVAAAGAAIGAVVGGEAGAAAGFNATANNYLSTADLRNRTQAVADCNGNTSCVAAVQQVSQETTLANNAKVLDACMGSGGDCSAAINKAQQDRSDLQAYREALVAQRSKATDPARRAAIESQIKQADAQIRSADTAIADGKLTAA